MHWIDRWEKLTGKRPNLEVKRRDHLVPLTGSIRDSARKLHSQQFKQTPNDRRRILAQRIRGNT